MSFFSRSQDEIFQEWKKSPDSKIQKWREYWEEQLFKHVELYRKLNWKLICLGYDSKIPVKGVHWTKQSLSYENALHLFRDKMNIGLDLFKSNLIVFEIDDIKIPEFLKGFMDKTMTVRSPRGFHVYFNFNKKIVRGMLDDKFKGLWRGCPNDSQYTVLPLSHVSKVDEVSGKEIYHHKYYEWIFKDTLLDISEVF